jgi:hypothetical protein
MHATRGWSNLASAGHLEMNFVLVVFAALQATCADR